jgi:hypothetical protein
MYASHRQGGADIPVCASTGWKTRSPFDFWEQTDWQLVSHRGIRLREYAYGGQAERIEFLATD